MKTHGVLTLALAVVAMFSFTACNGHGGMGKADSKTTVAKSTNAENLPRVVIRPFAAKGLSETEVSTLADKFCTEVSKFNKASLTCPGDLGKLLQHKEMQVMFGQCEEGECLAKVGEKVNADVFVLATISKVGEMFMVQVNLADGKNGKIHTRISHEVDSSAVEDLLPAMGEVAEKVIGEL